MNKIKILSFFSGGGFLDMGFEMADFEIVWSNEYDLAISELHSSGITSWRKANNNNNIAEIFNTNSIEEIKSEDIISEAFPNGKPPIFGIIGGPPCQDFSLNGKHKGFEGSRGKMTIQFFNKISQIKPTFFVMENVTGLIRNKSHKEYLSKLLRNIENDYLIDQKILNALDFVVPQSRERIFIVGIKKNYIKETDLERISFNWPYNEHYSEAAKAYEWPIPNPFKHRIKEPNKIPLELCVESCLVSDMDKKIIPNADEYFSLRTSLSKLSKIKEGETNRPSFKRLHRYKYSPTACYGNNEVHLHPYKNRRLSVRETLRIQGVPDTYVLPKGIPLTKKFKMIGNGVPVPLAHSVAKSLRNFIDKNSNYQIIKNI